VCVCVCVCVCVQYAELLPLLARRHSKGWKAVRRVFVVYFVCVCVCVCEFARAREGVCVCVCVCVLRVERLGVRGQGTPQV